MQTWNQIMQQETLYGSKAFFHRFAEVQSVWCSSIDKNHLKKHHDICFSTSKCIEM